MMDTNCIDDTMAMKYKLRK